jgi:hypothetical protein
MSGTTWRDEPPPHVGPGRGRHDFAGVQFDENPLTLIKAEALVELYDRQVQRNDPCAAFTRGMIEGFLEAQNPEFEIYTATEQLSKRLEAMLLERFLSAVL